MDALAARLVTVLTAAMPPARRPWGRAMLAELAYTRSRRDQARLVLGAARVALLPPPALAAYRDAAGRAALIAVLGWLPLATALYVTNVVLGNPPDSAPGVLLTDAYVIFTLMAAGAAARRAPAGPGTGPRVLAGLTAGLVLGVLTMATYAAIDNAFLSVVSQQQQTLAGFRASGLTSMRAYVNGSLEATAPGLTLMLALAGAVLAPLGAIADRQLILARARQRCLPHPEQIS
jgi:hypothetical protein